MSIESRHTPGPWRVDLAAYYPGTTSWLSIYCSSQSRPLAFVGGTPVTDECRANANLIAAAPDLLKALQELLEYPGGQYDTSGDYEAACAAAEQAIDKATGGQT